MDQENLSFEEINENEFKKENSKKLVVVILVLILLGGLYYYYAFKVDKNTKISDNQANITTESSSEKSGTVNSVDNKTGVKINTQAKQSTDLITNTTNPVNDSSTGIIKPTDKNNVIKLALASVGKKDPFASTRAVQSFSNGKKPVINGNLPISGNVLPPPPSTGVLPPLMGLPYPENAPPVEIPVQDRLVLKGFIGDKAIISINGLTEALGVNESFQGVKILKVDYRNLTAKFEKDGKIFTKTMKSLSDMTNRKDIKLIYR